MYKQAARSILGSGRNQSARTLLQRCDAVRIAPATTMTATSSGTIFRTFMESASDWPLASEKQLEESQQQQKYQSGQIYHRHNNPAISEQYSRPPQRQKQKVRHDGPLYNRHQAPLSSSPSASSNPGPEPNPSSKTTAVASTMSSGTAKKYPNASEIHALFFNLSTQPEAFFERVAHDVDWTVMGTHPLAGRYNSLSDFQAATFARLGKIMKAPGIRLKPRNVIGGGDQGWCTVELVVNGVCENGLAFDNCYAWCCRFDESGVIVEVRAYLDSWLVREAIVQNEVPSQRAEVPRVDAL
ncbi:unnamed protein product [Cercospora beticola]|nr:unnamed protein product [Cercospora beticola]